MKLIFLSVFLFVVAASASAQQGNGIEVNAPAGFTWGETKQQIESKGIAVKDCSEVELGLMCFADSAPKENSFVVKGYELVFIEGHGLQGAIMHTDNLTDDPTGYKGKQLYDEVKQSLISEYGQLESSEEYTGRELYDEPDEFYQCLEYAGCGAWASLWFGEGSVNLDIVGLRRGTGYISIGYMSKDVGAIYKKQEAAESIKDQDNDDAQLISVGAIAPAGFTWGESKQQIERKGIAFRGCFKEKFALVCVADSAPKEISFVQQYGLMFIEGRGLQKILMRTDDFTDDPTGDKGKQLYDKVKQNLTSKYGQLELSNEYTGRSVYDDTDEFYQCLKYAGCGVWVSAWDGEGTIALEIKGLRRGIGYLRIIYESKDWSDIVDKQEAAESIKDQESL